MQSKTLVTELVKHERVAKIDEVHFVCRLISPPFHNRTMTEPTASHFIDYMHHAKCKLLQHVASRTHKPQPLASSNVCWSPNVRLGNQLTQLKKASTECKTHDVIPGYRDGRQNELCRTSNIVFSLRNVRQLGRQYFTQWSSSRR